MPNIQLDHESLFDHVYTFASIGIALVSVEGAFLNVNPALCKILGYSKAELTSLTFQQLTYPGDLGKQLSYNADLLSARITSYEMDKRYIHKNGHPIWASLHVALVLDEMTNKPRYFLSHIIDISEKKATEELYKLISENAEEVIYCTTSDGTCYYCSPSIRSVLGYGPEELMGKQNLEIVHPDDLKLLQRAGAGDQHTVRYRNRHKDGRYIWFEFTFKIIDDGQGDPKVLAIGRDMTDRKRNEDILAEAQRIAAIGSWEWDVISGTIVLSEQVYQLGGIDRDTEIRHPEDIVGLVHPDERKSFKDAFKRAVKSGHLNFEFRHIQTNGLNQYLHMRGIVTLDENGIPLKMSGTIQDITDRKNVEFKLQETIERYTSLKKYNHDAVLSLDLEGNIVHGNAVAEQMTGYTIQELSGKSASILIDADHLNRILAESVNDASIEINIDKFKHRDGHHVEVFTTLVPIIINDVNVGFYIIAKDITEQKKLIIEKEAAESTSKSKGEFLAMMSHEIRTPMNGVIGMTDLLSETTNLDAEQREYVDIIRKSGYTLLSIINDILDFSKIDSGKTTLVQQPIHIRNSISETFDVLGPKASEKRLDMSCSVDPAIPETLIGDPDRLKQVLMNLVANAIKFTHDGGVTVTVKSAEPDNGEEDMQLVFTVIDTGIGIQPNKIHRLFEPFYQTDHFMTRSYEGTGLGLAISKKLVGLMDGHIWVEPPAGKGSTFVFTVRLKKSKPAQGISERLTEQKEQAAGPLQLNILIAEDNDINQLVLKRMLQKYGHRVTIAADGNEVCQKAVNQSYDLILMDIQMPLMNGLEATKVIKDKLPPDRHPIIVAVTANALKGDRERCLEAGMDDYISKPVKLEAVSEIVNKYFLK